MGSGTPSRSSNDSSAAWSGRGLIGVSPPGMSAPIDSEPYFDAMIGCTTGSRPSVRCVIRVRKSAIGHHLQVKLPTKGTHGQDIQFSPPVNLGENMYLTQQAFSIDSDLCPEKRHDIKENLPVMPTRGAFKVQLHFRLGVELVHLRGQRFDDGCGQILNVHCYP